MAASPTCVGAIKKKFLEVHSPVTRRKGEDSNADRRREKGGEPGRRGAGMSNRDEMSTAELARDCRDFWRADGGGDAWHEKKKKKRQEH